MSQKTSLTVLAIYLRKLTKRRVFARRVAFDSDSKLRGLGSVLHFVEKACIRLANIKMSFEGSKSEVRAHYCNIYDLNR